MMLARFGRGILLYYGCGRNTLANTAHAGHTFPHHRHPPSAIPVPGIHLLAAGRGQDAVSSASSPH